MMIRTMPNLLLLFVTVALTAAVDNDYADGCDTALWVLYYGCCWFVYGKNEKVL